MSSSWGVLGAALATLGLLAMLHHIDENQKNLEKAVKVLTRLNVLEARAELATIDRRRAGNW